MDSNTSSAEIMWAELWLVFGKYLRKDHLNLSTGMPLTSLGGMAIIHWLQLKYQLSFCNKM